MSKELHMVFLYLGKAYYRVPRELIWWCPRKKGVPVGYATIIKNMYNACGTLVSTRIGDTEYFHVGVGLHQGSSSHYTNHGRGRKGATVGDVVCG